MPTSTPIHQGQRLSPRRINVIGGSESAKIIGVSPYGNAMSVFNSKLGYVVEEASGEYLHWGNVLEGVIADEFATRRNVELENVGFIQDEDHSWFGGTPDRLIKGKQEGLEVKTAGIWGKDDWGEQGSDEIPSHYIIQAQHYMRLTKYPVWHFAVLIAGQEYREYACEEDLELQKMIFEADGDFWHNHIMTKIPPEIDGSEDAKVYLHARYPNEKGSLRQATVDEIKRMGTLKAAKEQKKMLEEVIATEENLIKEGIGDGLGIVNGQDKITWKATKDFLKTDYKRLAADYLRYCPDEYHTSFSNHTHEKKGVRRFLAQFKE